MALTLVGVIFVFSANQSLAAAGIFKQINFQGKVVNKTAGTNVADGNYDFTFVLYDAASGGSTLWTEARTGANQVAVTDGIFQVNLGSVTALPTTAILNVDNLYLGINFAGDGEMTTRVRFTAAPYAFNADNANNLAGGTWQTPGTIGSTTQNTGNFTTLNADSISTDTGGISIAAGQAYTGAGAVTLSSGGATGFTIDSASNTLTIAVSDTSLTASGVTTFTLGANTTITNASGNISLQAAGTGTANIQIGDGGAASGTPDLFILDIGSAEPTGSVGAMYYSTALNKFRCYQVSAWADCIGVGGSGYATIQDEAGALTQRSIINFTGAGVSCADDAGNTRTNCTIAGGGAQTPWAQDISAAGYDLGSLSNLGFQETTGAPTGTDVGFYRDNTGDLTGNVLTGKTLNLAVNGADEYNFSSTGLAFNSNNITGLGTNLTSTGALTIASTTTGLTLNSGSNTLTVDSSDTTLTASGVTNLTLGANTKITNASGNINLEAAAAGTGNVQIGDGATTSATPDLLVMDIGSAEPTGTNGATYYSTALNKFRCFENSAWKDCDTTGGGVSDGDKGDITVSGTGATWNVDYTSTDGTGATSNASGMETGTGGIGLLQGCSDGQILKWTESTSTWACAADSAGSGATTKYLTANHAISSTTGTEVTSISTTLAPGTYNFDYRLIVRSATTTVSPMYGINFTGTASNKNFWMQYADNTAALTGQVESADAVGITGAGFMGGMAQTNFSTTTPNMGHTVGVSAINTNIMVKITGIIVVTASGDLELWHGSETNTSTTIMAGSALVVTPISTGADLAEIYGTKDTSMEPGDVVSLDASMFAGVKKSDKAYDANAFGIISTEPSIVMGTVQDAGAISALVAFSGRVPVKVSKENGPIKAGDLLTSSSTAGVAMRAIKAGQIVGQAMAGFDGDGVGKIMAFVKNDYGNGSKLADIVSDSGQEEGDYSSNDLSKLALTQFIAQKEQLAVSTNLSEIMTDRLSAGLEIVTPKVIAEKVLLDKIEASTGLNINMNLSDGGVFNINDKDGKNNITFDSAGNATFQGTLTADAIVANKILGVELYTNKLSGIDESVSALNKKLEGLAKTTTEAVSFASLGILEKKGGLVIAKETTFKSATIFEKLATFAGNVIFRDEISFEKAPIFNKDMAGYAVVKEGENRVVITFDKAYEQAPVVNASLSLRQIKDEKNRNNAEKLLLSSGIRFIVTNVTEKGFEIRINEKADFNTPFAWNAITVKNLQAPIQDISLPDQQVASKEESVVASPVATPEATSDLPASTPAVNDIEQAGLITEKENSIVAVDESIIVN